ncbi:MAG: T9SS type A sorting domain-containing protein [Saprospiraceae bacterium]
MSKTMTFKSVALMVLLALGWQTASAQAFWTETFSDMTTATTNWVGGGTNAGTEVWQWTDDPLAGFMDPAIPALGSATASSGYFFFNSDANGQADHDITLTGVGAPADCSGKSNVQLTFYSQYIYYTAGASAQVGVSTDGTNFVYKDLYAGLGANAIFDGSTTVDLDEADGQSQVWIQFRWIGNYEYHWKVDDLELNEVAIPMANVTIRVNMANETVDPSGVFINGPLTGGTPEAMNDDGGGVYSITKTIVSGDEIQYRFMNGATAEDVDPACGVDNGGTYFRSYTAGDDATLAAVCFGECGPCVVPCDMNPNALICDNFDSYDTGMTTGDQASWWTTWSGATGGAEDGIVSSAQANTAPNSMQLLATGANGGPQDIVLDLGNQTSGYYELKWKMYFPAGKEGYYNIQDVVPIGAGSWNLDVFFSAGGVGNIQIGAGASLASFTYPNEEWINVRHLIDLDNNLLTLYINDVFVKKMAYPNNLGGIDFYGVNGSNEYFVDDLEYVSLPPVVYNVDICDAAVDLSQYFGQASGVAQTTGLYDNTSQAAEATDVAGSCWGESNVNTSMWYTFIGDGETYHIETVPCNATNYIGTAQDDLGDTQMAIYAGDDCSDLTEVACGDDLFSTGNPDWRAGLDLETEPGQNYYMLIDAFEFNNVVALGEFCIEITQVASVGCADGAVGTFTLDNNGFICFDGNLNTTMMPDAGSFVIPTVGPVAGMCWCITADPIPAGTWPGDIPGVASTVFNPDVILVNLPNDGSAFPAGTYYLTPVVVGAGELVDPAGLARVFNVDPSNGCYFTGASLPVTLLPQLDDLFALGSATDETVPPGNNGSITLAVSGGIAEVLGDPSLYLYNWSNGEATQDISGLAGNQTYTVTISDPTGCVADFTLSVTVGQVSGTTDPASVKSISITPNPTSADAVLQLSLEGAKDVRVEVVNTLGQVLRTYNSGTVQSLTQTINMADFAEGTYFLRISVDNETAVRRIAIQR